MLRKSSVEIACVHVSNVYQYTCTGLESCTVDKIELNLSERMWRAAKYASETADTL